VVGLVIEKCYQDDPVGFIARLATQQALGDGLVEPYFVEAVHEGYDCLVLGAACGAFLNRHRAYNPGL
jgi:hypothetical protein